MNNPPTFLAIIPARGGSKRLPGKNILELEGKPLIAWTIEASLKSKYITKTLVSSDDDEILNIAQKYGSDIIKRPDELSTDTATSFDAIKHAVLNQDENFDFVVLLQPTSPLRTTKHIDKAIELLLEKNAKAVISVCEVEHPVQWSMTLEDDLDMSQFVKNIDTKRSQDQKIHYRLNGAIYITNKEKLLEKCSFFLDSNIYSYIMDKSSSIDIDDEFDFNLAKLLITGT